VSSLVIDGVGTIVVDLGFIDTPDEVYGVGVDKYVNLGMIDATPVDDGVYGVSIGAGTGVNVNLKTVDEGEVVYGVGLYVLPGRTYRRIQLDGGGRLLFEATLADEPIEQFFELWKNGHPYPLASLANPIFSWKSPSGNRGTAVARIIDPYQGRVSARLFTPSEVGIWEIQLRFVSEVNFDNSPYLPDQEPPYAPPPGPEEYWRYLPKALTCIVRDEGGWVS